MTHPIPNAALDDRLGFIGTSGSGKTYNAGGAVERLLARKARVVIVDPLGVWWGLRLNADGKAQSDFNVVIFGGPHGDLPLSDHAGALIGETAATMAESCIIDLSELGTKASERTFMTAFLEAIYRKANKEPFHLVVDEADLFAPQKPPKGDETLLNRMEQIVRRGRVKGFIPWLISQRPAVLNKNVLSQVDGLVAFKLTASQDRDALDSWIEGQADKAQGRAIKDQLPAMQIGQGVVWVPGRSVLTTASFPAKATFDSSRTPKRGEKLKRTAELKPLDLGALKERLATVETEAKANDPKALRAEIARLKRDAAKPVVQVDQGAIDTAERCGHAAGWNEAMQLVMSTVDQAANALTALQHTAHIKEAVGAAPVRQTAPKIAQRPSSNSPPVASLDHHDRPLGAERKPLAALAGVYPSGLTEAQWAVAAGMKRTGGSWRTYKSKLTTTGRAERRAGLWFATAVGMSDIGTDFEVPPPPGLDLVEYWATRVGAAAPMLRLIAHAYPNGMTRQEIGAGLNMSIDGGSFRTYLSKLRSPGLIETNGDIVTASPDLMDGAA